MAENKKKSQYDFGGHKFDTELYLQNLRDNAESFLNSRTDWTPEQKEEWKHSYTNFTNALQEDINNGTGRFSTDEFGTITDRNGEFNNNDSDNYYYNKKGEQISQEDYNNLKARKQGKYKTFEANRQFASYANQVGKSLRDALLAKGVKSADSSQFDYAKNGFDTYWQKKYNPAGTVNDLTPYWSKDEEGKYTNRITETMADLDDYMSKQEMNDDVRAAYQNYRDVLSQYTPDSKDFNLDKWKNNLVLAANRAGISTWNNGYFNVGSTNTQSTSEQKTFNINDDEQALAYAGLTDQALAHPELRDTLLAQARRKYQQESQAIIDNDAAEQKQLQDAQNNKIWQQWLANNQSYANVSKRNFGTEVFGNGWTNGNSDFEYASGTSQEAMKRLQSAFRTGNRKGDFLRTSINMTVNGGKQKISNLGEALAYYKPLLDKTEGGWSDFEKVQDSAGNEIYKLKGSENAKGQPLYIWFKNGKAHAYRDDPYSVRRAQVISKAQSGMKLQTRAEKAAAKEKENQKAINNPTTPEDKKRQLAGQRKPGDTEFTATDIARITSAGMDVASALSAFVPIYGTALSAGTGLASSLTSFGTDLFDKSVSLGGAFKNLGANVAMDAVGLVPGFGVAGKAGKITKNLVKYVPKIVTVLSAANALSPESRASWAKLASNESLTVKDWQNIAAGCSAIAGVSRGAVGHLNAHTMAKGTKTKDFNITAADGKQYKITSEQLETLKNQKSLEDINKEFKKIYPSAELNSFFRNGKWQQLRHLHFNNPQVKSVYDFSRLNNQGTFSNANIWKVARENNLHGLSIDVKNPYKNSLLNPASQVSTKPSNKKYETPRVSTKTKQQIVNSPLNNSPERYNYIRRSVQSNTGDDVKTWRDLFTQNHFYFKEGGSIQKFNPGGVVNGNPLMSSLQGKKVNNPETDYETAFDTSRVYSIDPNTGLIKDNATISNKSGNAPQRYQAAEGNILENTRKIEAHPYYQWLTSQLYNNHQITDAGTAWQGLTDVNLPENSEASFKDANGNYRASWTNKNNDIYGNPGKSYTTHEDYTNGVRFDGINGARHDVLLNRGTRYYYTDTEGNKQYVKLSDDDKKNYSISEKPTWSGWSKDQHTWWDDYEITGLNSQVNTADEEQQKDPNKNFQLSDILGKIDVTDKWGIPRAIYADNTNRQVTDLLKKQPLLLDPQEDLRYVRSDYDSEVNGQNTEAQLNRLAGQSITSDGNLQTVAQRDAAIKGREAVVQGKQLSNQRQRETEEQAWQQELANHTNRYKIAMTNRQSIYDTANQNRSLEAAYLNQKFTVWDALAQEKEFKEKSDYEQTRARLDQRAQREIEDNVKNNLQAYVGQYGLTNDDVKLYNDVYTTGTKKISDIQADPALLRRWTKIGEAITNLKNDMLYEYYGVPHSKYYYARSNAGWSPNAQVKTNQLIGGKKGAKLNYSKVREAAKGEKLAAAQLKAQTADADRFYKTTKDHIDRMYDAIDRLTNYSSKKRKKKKSS